MGFKSILVTAILFGLFCFGLISFAYQITTDNNPNSGLLNDSSLNKTFSILNQTLPTYSNIANSSIDATTGTSSYTIGLDSIVSLAIVGVTNTFLKIPIAIFSLIFGMSQSVLGLPPIVTGMLLVILLITIIFAIWRLIKIGS